ncbi:MAG TPA: glycosyltransferase [Gammaproteobacteria bacterium]|nr:glycosyltransferase [Gammaproteobacteria bacterium]
MPDMPTVSVIIPTRDRALFVTRAIESVLNQSRLPEEIIVIDDGSTDGTSGILAREFPLAKVLQSDGRGVSAARNLGIQYAEGDWIALLDSDDTWHGNKLKRQLLALEENPAYRVCHTNEIWIRDGVRVNPMKKHQKRGGFIFRDCLPRCAMSPSSTLIHREIFERVGMFDENLPACEDYDLWLRISARYPVLFINKELVTKYGGHEDQLSQKYPAMDRFRIRSLARLLDQVDLDPDDRTAAIETLLGKIRIYLNGAEKHGNNNHVTSFRKLQARYAESIFRNVCNE